MLAQLVEQVTLNHRVGGSSPSQPTCDRNFLTKPKRNASVAIGLNRLKFSIFSDLVLSDGARFK